MSDELLYLLSLVRFRRIHDGHNETDYVYIQHGHGCASSVGFWSGKQVLFLHKKVSEFN